VENDEEPIVHMARVMYETLREQGMVNPTFGWDYLPGPIKFQLETAAAKAHEAYHDQYDRLAEKAGRR
jgi:hypothetical protein